MRHYDLGQLGDAEIARLCRRVALDFGAVLPVVREVLDAVRENGDRVLAEFTARFDGVQNCELRVTQSEIDAACQRVPADIQSAFQQAVQNVRQFHQKQLRGRITCETMAGVTCFSEARALQKVGLYAPGGATPLPSTVMMLAVPAMLAGCSEIVLATPPAKDGSIADAMLFVAMLCGVTQILRVGGAQAIAALAYGTATVPKVDKIFGPGNQYVTAAKMLVAADSAGAAIDMPAGPTELLIIADEAARADFVASDLLSQAEHSPDAQVVLVATSRAKADEVEKSLADQLQHLPRRQIAEQALKNAIALTAGSVENALKFANRYAPEHLILNVQNPADYVPMVRNAGSVFLGEYACEAAGDYASGTNHSLPTDGFARAYSGVSVASFQKQITFQSVSRAGAQNLSPIVQKLAEVENLEGHRRAMALRVN